MGNIPSKRHSHLSSSSKNGSASQPGNSRPSSLAGSTALSLSRFPSLGGTQPSSIPENVVIANNPDRKASEPILIRPRIPPALTEGVGSSSALSSITGSVSIPNGHLSKQPVIDEVTAISSSLNHSSSVSSCLGNVNVNEVLTRLLEVGYSGRVSKNFCLKNSEITAICSAAREIFLSQPTLLELSPPVKIVGDIHGQYHDLLRLFEMCSYPPATNYLFLGDYVDRGKQSLETIMLLLCYKIKFPENFFLLRGNHECANVTRVYGFYDECKRRMTVKTWKTFVTTFNTMPIAALVANKIFCVHGGLSPSLTSMDDVRRITRPTEIPDYGLLNDLLWSDPSDAALEWDDNERGVSYCFGRKVVGEFLARHDLDLVCRAHMVVEDGYEFFADRQLVTLFSAPNYCGEFDNYGAVMGVGEELMCSFELLKPMEGNFGALNNSRRLSGYTAVAATPSEAASDANEEMSPVSPPG